MDIFIFLWIFREKFDLLIIFEFCVSLASHLVPSQKIYFFISISLFVVFIFHQENKNNRITHSTLKRKIDIQTTKIRTENKISKQKMIMSANKNNHNRSACKIFMSKNNPSKMQACFFKARKSRFCYPLSPPIKPEKILLKTCP